MPDDSLDFAAGGIARIFKLCCLAGEQSVLRALIGAVVGGLSAHFQASLVDQWIHDMGGKGHCPISQC